jgi:hypothetical protein
VQSAARASSQSGQGLPVLQRRFFALIHSNDPDIRFEPVGATAVMWNSEERMGSSRR